MSLSKNKLSQEQRIFEIEERVYKLLAPEFRTIYSVYRKVPTFPEEDKQKYGNKTAEHLDIIATEIANRFTLNYSKPLTTEEDIEIKEIKMNTNNLNMQDLAQVIAAAVTTAISNNKNHTEYNNVRIPIPSTYSG